MSSPLLSTLDLQLLDLHEKYVRKEYRVIVDRYYIQLRKKNGFESFLRSQNPR